jgi:hypothetical protein
MLVRLLYASRAVEPINQALLDSILQQSRTQNAELGITGVLCAYEDGNGFLQALEGGRTEVNMLYNKIVCDDRHTDVVLLSYEEVDERRFANWRMGRIELGRVNPSVLLRYSEHPRLEPLSLTARAAMALLEELTSTLPAG